jgi:pyruvate dehydrogenase E2 component (dihydrolipoamide acetyltransferase)
MTDAWVVLLALGSLVLIAFGLLAGAWTRGRLGLASGVVFVVAVVAWAADVVALTSDYRDADGFVDCGESCTAMHRLAALGFVAPPLLISLAAAGMLVALVARGRRHRESFQRSDRSTSAFTALGALQPESGLMAHSFKLPDLGEGLTEGEVARWLVSEGATVAEDDPLVEVQTDKATVEIPSPYAGTVLRILVGEGEVAPVGTVLVVIGEAGEELPGPVKPRDTVSQGDGAARGTAAPAGARPERVAATPLVRRIAEELGVDLSSLGGTGPGGRITEEDVRGAAAGAPAAEEGRRVPVRGVRRVIAENMARAHREVPAVTWVEECDFENVEMERLLPTVVKACAESLAQFPELNARFEGDSILYLERYDIAVAVQTPDGLVVAVVREVDAKSVDELDSEIRRLAESARTGSLKPEEVRGSTFTVTSAGKLAGLFQTPIVHHPEVAILSIGRIAPRPVVRDGEVVVRRVGTIAVSFDHRVVDGARAAEFGLDVIRRLEGG